MRNPRHRIVQKTYVAEEAKKNSASISIQMPVAAEIPLASDYLRWFLLQF